MKINDALRLSRARSGKSQEYMALELEIARKTVQNWEKGVSEPTIKQAIEWFKVIGQSPIPYLFQVVHENMDGLSSEDDIDSLRTSLINLLNYLPEEGVRQLLFLFYGNHGSSPRAVMNMVTAHLQTPMKDRVTNGTVILKNYDIANLKHNLTSENNIKPNRDFLLRAIELGEDAVINDNEAYVVDGYCTDVKNSSML